MALRFAAEPQNGTALVRGGLDRMAARRSPLTGRTADVAALAIRPPHAIYDLRADAVAAGKGLEAAHATGFRYSLEDAKGAVAAAEVLLDKSGAAAQLANINHGPYVQASARAFARLASLKEVVAAHYEARLLRFSAIFLVAVWLKPESADQQDLIYPLEPAPAPLVADKRYSVAEFFKLILPLARKRADNLSGPLAS